MKQIPLPIGPQPQPCFDNFLPGDNAAAVAHMRELALPGAPLYLWGPAGSGKSHLLRALAGRCQTAGQQIGWFDAADRLPWTLQPDWSLVVIDRCEALSPEAQHAAFALFVEAGTHGVQVAGPGVCRRWICPCVKICARAWAGAMSSRCNPCPKPTPAPRCAARPTTAASSCLTR
jgi:DnaA family protein